MGKKKIQSRRRTFKKKFKIKKKVQNHNKKVNKLARRMNRRKKLMRDPGIPNLWPEKMKMLTQIQSARIEKKIEEEEEKMAKMEKKFVNIGMEAKERELLQLELNARQKQRDFQLKEDFEKESSEMLPQEFGKTTSKFYRDFKNVVAQSDVIIEVLDARDPLGCRSLSIERQILSSDPNKRIILLLNKIDLVPQEVVEKWLAYLRLEFPAFPFKSSTQKQTKLGNTTGFKGGVNDAPANLRFGGKALGKENLIRVLKNYCRSKGSKKMIMVGVIGFPNVGKSSVINSLKGKRVANVGAKPGITSKLQVFKYDRDIQFIDCPGIIFAPNRGKSIDSDIILRNCVDISLLTDPITPVDIIRRRCSNDRLTKHYQIPHFETTEEFLSQIAYKSGKLLKGGKPNLFEAGKIVLRDWNSGNIPFFTLPPNKEPVFSRKGYNNSVEWGVLDDSSVLKRIKSFRDKETENMIPMLASLSLN